ncbi:DUF459 domain-containing protein [Myxococcaceae bacterium GXIMD 01537]
MKNRLARALVCLALCLAETALAASDAPTPPPPTSPAPPAAGEPTPPASTAPARTVLLLGDSLLATGFGRDLQGRLEQHADIRCARRAKSSTGLARPDFFDWMDVGREEVAKHQPDVVVVILGGNDGQGITDAEGKAVALWGTDDWESTYRERLVTFLQVLSAPGRRILWVELPATRLPGFERKLTRIRRVQREVLSAHADAHLLDTRPFFTDAKGRPLSHAPVEGFRKPKQLRMDDGVHFTTAGGRYFATKVYPEVLALLQPQVASDT